MGCTMHLATLLAFEWNMVPSNIAAQHACLLRVDIAQAYILSGLSPCIWFLRLKRKSCNAAKGWATLSGVGH